MQPTEQSKKLKQEESEASQRYAMELSVTEDRKATQCSNPEIAGDEGLPTLNDDRARSLGYQNHSDRLLHSSLAVDHTEDTRMERYTTNNLS